MLIMVEGHRVILQGKVLQLKFSDWIRGYWGGFLSYWNPHIIKFEEEKREMNTFENFPCEFFPCKISLCLKVLQN